MRPRILVNALHTTTGGGLTYLNGILPALAQDTRFDWTVLLAAEGVGKVKVPLSMAVRVAPPLNFWKGHLYEQFVVPFLAVKWGMKAVLCNANYVPLLAPRPLPIIHTTPRAAGQAKTRGMKLYWAALRLLTRISLLRAPMAFSVAQHVIADYANPRTARKVRVANPAVALPEVMEDVKLDPNLVVTVGDFYPQKNYPMLLRAFRILRERRPATRLLIVGRPIDPLVRDEVLGLVRELGLAEAVTLTGAVPHADLLKTLRRARVYINTSQAECFNMPVLEALACGVPCVLPDVDFQVEVAGPAAVYVPVDKGGDVEAAFAVAMYGILENPGVADTLRKAALARAGLFSWANTARIMGDGLAQLFGK